MRLLLVRHAEPVPPGTPGFEEDQRPLSRAGRAAAEALDALRARHPAGGTVLAGSHGNLIALMLAAMRPGVDFAFWAAIPMPAVYLLEHDGEGWRARSGPGLA